MVDNIEKDTNTGNGKRTIMNVGWIFLVLSGIFSIWNNYGGTNTFLQFASTAAPWVMLGIGLACCVASHLNSRS